MHICNLSTWNKARPSGVQAKPQQHRQLRACLHKMKPVPTTASTTKIFAPMAADPLMWAILGAFGLQKGKTSLGGANAPLIPELRKQKRANPCDFKAILVYRVKCTRLYSETLC